jgi:hypothetical protein
MRAMADLGAGRTGGINDKQGHVTREKSLGVAGGKLNGEVFYHSAQTTRGGYYVQGENSRLSPTKRGPVNAATRRGTGFDQYRFMGMNAEKAEQRRRRAFECERRAVLATDDEVRHTFFSLAHQWREMAEQVEELEERHAAVEAGE